VGFLWVGCPACFYSTWLLVVFHCSHSAADIADKQVVLFSYGSGLASSMYMLRLASDYSPGSVLDRLMSTISDVRARLDSRMKVEPAEFARIMKLREDTHHSGKSLFVYSACIFADKTFSSLLSFIQLTFSFCVLILLVR